MTRTRMFAAMAVIVGLIMPLGVLAASTPTPSATPTPGEGLEISPPVIELSADPGQTITTQIRLRDVSTGQLVAAPRVDDFGAKDETGEPNILLNEVGTTRYSLKTWVQPIAPLTLSPDQLQTITVTIVVPSNAEPGGHYGVVRFTASPPGSSGSGVSLSASIGSLVLLTVSGDITEGLKADDFYALQNNNRHSFFQKGPIEFLERYEDTGTVHLSPTGNVVIKNMLGRQVAKLPINNVTPPGNVLPSSIRRFTENWTDKFPLGRYTATATVGYGTHGQVLTSTIAFWVIPWPQVVGILVVLILIIMAIRWFVRGYNRRIIERARRG
jgi:hypothetical protein